MDLDTEAACRKLSADSLLREPSGCKQPKCFILLSNLLAFTHLDILEARAGQMLASLTLSGLEPCDLCPSLIEGL